MKCKWRHKSGRQRTVGFFRGDDGAAWGPLTVSTVLFDGGSWELDGAVAGVVLWEGQVLQVHLCVQNVHLQIWRRKKTSRRCWNSGQTMLHYTFYIITTICCVFLPILGALSEKRFPYMLLASRKAPFSRTSSSIVAVWACSVLFMSCHDSRASGRSRLSTVCTTAWHEHEAKHSLLPLLGTFYNKVRKILSSSQGTKNKQIKQLTNN